MVQRRYSGGGQPSLLGSAPRSDASPPVSPVLAIKADSSIYQALESPQPCPVMTSSVPKQCKDIRKRTTSSSPSTVGTLSDGSCSPERQDLRSLVVIMAVVFVGEMARGVGNPTLWPYLSSMGGNRIGLGYTVACFSAGRMVSSPLLGHWSHQASYRTVLVASLAVVILGDLIYATATSWHTLLIAQLVIGVGTGTLGVTRAYVADKTIGAQRTYLLAYLNAVQYAGFTVTPLLGSIITTALGPVGTGTTTVWYLRKEFNQYTVPAYLMVFTCLWTIVALCTVFTNHRAVRKPIADKQELLRASQVEDQMEAGGKATTPPTTAPASPLSPQPLHSSFFGQTHLEWGLGNLQHQFQTARQWRPSRFGWAVLGNCMLNVLCKGVMACFETLGTAYIMSQFNLSNTDSGWIFSAFGALGVLALLSMRKLCQLFDDMQLTLGGTMATILSCIMLAFRPNGNFGLIFFCVAVGLTYSIGYPIGSTAILSSFSKLMGNRPQGALLGYYASVGSLARIIFPIMAGFVSQDLGYNAVFGALAVPLALAALVVLGTRHMYNDFMAAHG